MTSFLKIVWLRIFDFRFQKKNYPTSKIFLRLRFFSFAAGCVWLCLVVFKSKILKEYLRDFMRFGRKNRKINLSRPSDGVRRSSWTFFHVEFYALSLPDTFRAFWERLGLVRSKKRHFLQDWTGFQKARVDQPCTPL